MPSAGDQWCSNGTVNGGAAAYAILDAAIALPPPLDLAGFFSIIWSAIGVVTIATTDLCHNPPRYPGDPSFQDVIDWGNPLLQPALLQKYTQLLIYFAWPQFCTCSTFVSPYVAYPAPPTLPANPPSLPSQSTPLDVTCSFSDLYNKLNAMQGLLRLILATVGPHTYMLGNTHTVSGKGELTVSGIMGVITHPLSYAPGVGYELDDPPRYFETGWMAFGDSNGWYEHRRMLHDPQFHIGIPTGVTKLGYTCELVTSLEITELIPSVLYQGN